MARVCSMLLLAIEQNIYRMLLKNIRVPPTFFVVWYLVLSADEKFVATTTFPYRMVYGSLAAFFVRCKYYFAFVFGKSVHGMLPFRYAYLDSNEMNTEAIHDDGKFGNEY